MCRVLGVSSSGYYDWIKRNPSEREKRKLRLMNLIEQIHQNNKGRYGAPRIYQALKAQGIKICQTTVRRWMREAGLRAKTWRKFRVTTTDSKHKLPIAENILNRNFTPATPGEIGLAEMKCFILSSFKAKIPFVRTPRSLTIVDLGRWVSPLFLRILRC